MGEKTPPRENADYCLACGVSFIMLFVVSRESLHCPPCAPLVNSIEQFVHGASEVIRCAQLLKQRIW